MGMYELALNSCYIKDGLTRYRDFENDMDARDLARELAWMLADIELSSYDDNFDEEAFIEEYDSDYEYNEDGELVRVRNTVTQSKLEEEREIQEYFKQGLTLEEIGTIEYRKAKRQLIKAEAEKKEQDRIDFFESFTQPKTIFGFFGFYLANFAY